MHERLSAIAARQGGVFTAAQAQECGYHRTQVQVLARTRRWVRMRRGVYAEAELYQSLDPHARHVLQIRGLLLVLGAPAYVSHFSAAVVHRLELMKHDVSTLHICRTNQGSSRIEAGVTHHRGALADGHVDVVDGIPVTSLARTAVDCARHLSFSEAVVALDSALRRGVGRADLQAAHEFCAHWSGSPTAGQALAAADHRSESAGETLCRLLLASLGLPKPDLQRELFDARGLIGRVDFFLEEQETVVEFDGRVKYGVPEGVDAALAGEVVWKEKRREDRLRALGLEVVRITWPDLSRPADVAARLRQAFLRTRLRRGLVS